MNPIRRSTGEIAIACPYYDTAKPTSDGTKTPPLVPPPCSELPAGGDEMMALAELIARADQSDRKDARRNEDIANQAEAARDADRVNAMLDKAQQDFWAAVAQGAGEIVGGACTATAGFVGDPAAKPRDPAAKQYDFFIGCGKAAPGIGNIAAAFPKKDAEKDDATAARDQAASSVDERLSREAHEDAQNALDSLKKLEEFLQAVQQSKNAAEQAAASFRA